MVAQDQNAFLLFKTKSLETELELIKDEYGSLIEQSVQKKVAIRRDMNSLKTELQSALTRSRPKSFKKVENKPSLNELNEINDQIVQRIESFKNTTSLHDLQSSVVARYKPQMELMLGEIYSFDGYMPNENVLERFKNQIALIEKEISQMKAQVLNDHDTNVQLQTEANQLLTKVNEQIEETNRLKEQNGQLQGEIEYLTKIAEGEISIMEKELGRNLQEEVENPQPSSARSIVVNSGKFGQCLKKTDSQKRLFHKDSSIPSVSPIEEYIIFQKSQLLEKINQLYSN